MTGPTGVAGPTGIIGPTGSPFSFTGIYNLNNQVYIENVQENLYITAPSSVEIHNFQYYPYLTYIYNPDIYTGEVFDKNIGDSVPQLHHSCLPWVPWVMQYKYNAFYLCCVTPGG